MPGPSKDLQTQLSSLSHELELSTFLNKGVLQSNAEFKLRIVELERENAVLRTAESRLGDTEDRLELAERAVLRLEEERDARAQEWEDKIRGALEARQGLEAEVAALKAEMGKWRQIGQQAAHLVGYGPGGSGVGSAGAGAGRGKEDNGQTRRAGGGSTAAANLSARMRKMQEQSDKEAESKDKQLDAAASASVPRDVPRQRETTRDRAYLTRTAGPAPALLRGDLHAESRTDRTDAGPSRSTRTTPNRGIKSRTSAIHTSPAARASAPRASGSASAKKRRRRVDDSGSASSDADEEPVVSPPPRYPLSESVNSDQEEEEEEEQEMEEQEEDQVQEQAQDEPSESDRSPTPAPPPPPSRKRRLSRSRHADAAPAPVPAAASARTTSQPRAPREKREPVTPPPPPPPASKRQRKQTTERSRATERAPHAPAMSTVKLEPDSPTRHSVADSEDDPLAMDF